MDGGLRGLKSRRLSVFRGVAVPLILGDETFCVSIDQLRYKERVTKNALRRTRYEERVQVHASSEPNLDSKHVLVSRFS